MPKRYDNNCVLIFGDTHAPFQNKWCLEFLADINSTYHPDRVIMNGDLTDSYWFSKYGQDLKAERQSVELSRMQEFTQDLELIFPKMTITNSNHDVRLWNKAKAAGIPRAMLIDYMQMIGAKQYDWDLVEDAMFTVDADRSKWQVSHWKTGTAITTSQKVGRNIVLSHHHTRQGVGRWSPEPGRNLWGCDTGCLIDRKAYAFAYAKANALQQVTGALLIEAGIPRTIPLI